MATKKKKVSKKKRKPTPEDAALELVLAVQDFIDANDDPFLRGGIHWQMAVERLRVAIKPFEEVAP